VITIKQYAKKKKISERTARKQLDRKVDLGQMERQKGPSNSYVYYEPKYKEFRWHDPFNKISLARPIPKDKGKNTKAVERPAQVQQQKPLAINGEAVAYSSPLQHWFEHLRRRRANADHGSNPAQA
jgi:hypothetical protein